MLSISLKDFGTTRSKPSMISYYTPKTENTVGLKTNDVVLPSSISVVCSSLSRSQKTSAKHETISYDTPKSKNTVEDE